MHPFLLKKAVKAVFNAGFPYYIQLMERKRNLRIFLEFI
jgi:hypothetical protein